MNLNNLIIAHRGCFNNKNIPENSILAFETALNKKLSIEFDVQITKDNELIVFHDNNLYRMTGINKEIRKTNYNEIKNLTLLNTNQKIPKFKDVLTLINGKVLIDIEIKNTRKKEKIIKLILKELENYHGKVLLKSFNPMIIKSIKKKTNKYKLGLLITKQYHNLFLNIIFQTNLLLKYFKPDFLAINKIIINKKYYTKYSKLYSIFLWTITNKEQIKEYKSMYSNLSYICNNL